MYYLVCQILLSISILVYHFVSLRNLRKLQQINDLERENTIKINNNQKRVITDGVEVYIQTLNEQRVSLTHFINELYEQEGQYSHLDITEDNDIARTIRMNSELLESVHSSLDKLETWYFLNHGKYYMK